MSLATPIEIQKLQRALHIKAKGNGMGESLSLAAASAEPFRPVDCTASGVWFVSGPARPRSRGPRIRDVSCESRMREICMSGLTSGRWKRSTAEILRHRQPKGSATDRPRLNHRATSRLYTALRRAFSPLTPRFFDDGFRALIRRPHRSPKRSDCERWCTGSMFDRRHRFVTEPAGIRRKLA